MKTVACLAGDGVGPELMAAATRALDRVSPRCTRSSSTTSICRSAGEAVTRSGHPLPAATRDGYRDVDAILVASPNEPAFEGVKADLQLAWRIARVHLGERADVVVVAPLGDWADAIAVERAFTCASSRRGRVVAVGDRRQLARVRRARAGALAGLEVRASGARRGAHPPAASVPRMLDVVVTESHLFDALVDASSHFAGSAATVAHGWLPDNGPGVFAPGEAEGDDVAGFGVADPTGMLLTASLMLAEGLKRRSASRTLERAVGAVAERTTTRPRETQSFTDAVIELLPSARTDLEHFDEVWR